MYGAIKQHLSAQIDEIKKRWSIQGRARLEHGSAGPCGRDTAAGRAEYVRQQLPRACQSPRGRPGRAQGAA